jgi:hypothetical protein
LSRTTITRIAVHHESDSPIFGETVVNVELQDEAAGPFLLLSNPCPPHTEYAGKVAIDFAEWPHVIAAAKTLMEQEGGKE